jgi:biopolymer transport protein ExbB/TolQ
MSHQQYFHLKSTFFIESFRILQSLMKSVLLEKTFSDLQESILSIRSIQEEIQKMSPKEDKKETFTQSSQEFSNQLNKLEIDLLSLKNENCIEQRLIHLLLLSRQRIRKLKSRLEPFARLLFSKQFHQKATKRLL